MRNIKNNVRPASMIGRQKLILVFDEASALLGIDTFTLLRRPAGYAVCNL